MTMETRTQPQVESQEKPEQPGLETAQVVEKPLEDTSGAEDGDKAKAKEKAPEPRTYSEEEMAGVNQHTAALDKENAGLRSQLAESALQAEIAEAKVTESKAEADDEAALESGTLTEAGAAKNRRQRESLAKERAEVQKQATKNKADMAVIAQGERTTLAGKLEKHYGLDADVLLNDGRLQSAETLFIQAVTLENERLTEEIKALKTPGETFDSAQAAITSGAEPTTAMELIKAGFEEEAKKRK